MNKPVEWTVEDVRRMLEKTPACKNKVGDISPYNMYGGSNKFKLELSGYSLTYDLMKEVSVALQTTDIDVDHSTENGYYDSVDVTLHLIVTMPV